MDSGTAEISFLIISALFSFVKEKNYFFGEC